MFDHQFREENNKRDEETNTESNEWVEKVD